MYVSKTFTKFRKSVLYAEYPSNEAQSSIYPNGKHIFPQFIVKFLKMELRKWNGLFEKKSKQEREGRVEDMEFPGISKK